ncbi:MAG: C45 family peptidase [Planctomycetota bacterium]
MNHRTRPSAGRRILLLGTWVVWASRLSIAAPPANVTGSLEKVNGVRVLKLWGTPYERGYAHGYLVGPDIVQLFQTAVLDPRILADPQRYETAVRRDFAAKMKFDPERREELKGMLDGIVASVGPAGLRMERLGRNLDLGDLEAVNALADWYRFLCSSFSAWGDGQGGGEMVTARNLDFLTLPGLDTQHLIIVYLDPGPGKKRWVSLAWSGLIGAYTAMNEEGVTISMHDAEGRQPSGAGPFVPRSIALRDALEAATAADAVADVRRVLSVEASIGGNNIHVSAPFTNQPHPAAIFEYDGDLSSDGGITVRLSPAAAQSGWIACTNHYLLRGPLTEGARQDSAVRYATLEQALRKARETHARIDLAFARKVMAEVANRGTLQSVVFFPNRKEMYVGLAAPGVTAVSVEPVPFRLEDLLRR